MCGIAGSIGHGPGPSARIEAATRAIGHRGPDGRGRWAGAVGGRHVTLAHTRLSIIDLDVRANQPFQSDGCVLSYNGEIYNYRELRQELVAYGHSFRTQSDTEVLVKAWRTWGAKCLDRLEGMWAFALVDTERGQIMLSRDRFGEKPLYFWQTAQALHFSSEVRALAALEGRWPEIDDAQIRRFLVNGYKSLYKQPSTFYRDVRELPSGTALLIGDDPAVAIDPLAQARRYWSLAYAPARMTEAEAVAGVRDRLMRSVELRLRSDVPLAFCLSGGVDSTALASIAAKSLGCNVHAFSILDGDERYNESRNIEATARDIGCTLHTVHTETTGFLDRLARQTAGRDAPVATISYFMHDFLSQAIHAEGYKVAISGTAADELFTGYYDHYGFWLAEMAESAGDDARLADWRASYGAWVQNPILRDPLAFKSDPGQRDHIYLDRDNFNRLLTTPCSETFFEASYSDNTLRNRMMNELFHESIPMILREDDLNSMRWSVENRSPYLDRALVEFAYTIPNALLIKDGYPKWPLRSAVAGILNDTTRLDKRKRGFNASINSLLDRKAPNVVDRVMAAGPIFDYLRRDAVEELMRSDLASNSFSKLAFSLVATKLFLEADRSPASVGLAA